MIKQLFVLLSLYENACGRFRQGEGTLTPFVALLQ